MNNKKINILFSILMMAALVGGVLLVRQNANTERGAYFAGTKLLLQPESILGGVGEKANVQLFMETANGAKVSSIDTVVCYGNGLSLDANNLESQVILNTAVLKDLVDVSLNNNCVRIVALAGATMKPTDLKSGMVKIADIKFDAVAQASGQITIKQANTKVGGYNPSAGATDNSLEVTSVTAASYTVGEEVVLPTIPPTCHQACPASDGILKSCTPPDGDGTSKDSICNTAGRVEPCNNINYCCPVKDGQWTTDMTKCPSVTPTTPVSSSDLMLYFRMRFYGVDENAKCATADKTPLSVTVRSATGVNKTYSNIMARIVGGGVYGVYVPLTGFDFKDNISVFIKSPKSLQVKYGKDGQDVFYNQAGGELSGLTNNLDTTKGFDFTKYPLLMGDVTGSNNVQDGVVDGLDFSYIKSEAVKRTEVADGGYMTADMNGNCKMESQDLSNMMLSLSVKQGQLY
ncbi:MAG: hypothetical protein WAV41_03275 [Microgenomates group bacterium]